MKTFIYWLGVTISVLATVGMVAHRFYNPDMTQIRWFIEFWYIWLTWFVSVLIGAFMIIEIDKMGKKYYVVICTWYADEYDNGTVEVIKVFTEKDKADTYCDNKNKHPKKYSNIKEEYTVVEESKEDG